MVSGKSKLWTRQEGLTAIKKWALGKAVVKTELKQESEQEQLVKFNPVALFFGRIFHQVTSLLEGTHKLAELLKKFTSKNYIRAKQTPVHDKNYLFVFYFLFDIFLIIARL